MFAQLSVNCVDFVLYFIKNLKGDCYYVIFCSVLLCSVMPASVPVSSSEDWMSVRTPG